MPLLNKILLLFVILNSLFLILGSPPPSFAEAQNACKTQDDCASSQYGTFCKCEYGFDENQHCLPNPNVANTRGGYCTTGVQCIPDKFGYECGNDESCVSYNGGFWCLPDKDATPDLAASWYIVTPQEVADRLNSSDESIDSLTAKTEFITTTIGILSTAIAPSDTSGTQANGALGAITRIVLNLSTKPAISSKEYLADIGKNIGIFPNTGAYAQGIGFSAFSTTLSIWRFSRNIAYVAFVAIFVITGLMVMFRQKIDPRTVVTIQEALPKMIATIIIITFSYAIAGLMIDIGEFSTRLVGNALSNAELIAFHGDSAQKRDTLSMLYAKNIFQLMGPIRNTDKITQELSNSNIPGLNIPVLGEITVDLIFKIAGFFIMFKIFFALIGPYAGIILSVIFAPLMLLPGALPGNQNSFLSWIKGLLAKILVFPATFALLAIAAVLKGYLAQESVAGGNANWDIAAGKYASQWSPVVIGQWGDAVGSLVSFGILFTIPHVVEVIQAAFQEKPQPWAQAPGTEIKSALSKLPVVGGIASSL